MAENHNNMNGHPPSLKSWEGAVTSSSSASSHHTSSPQVSLAPIPGESRTDEQLLLDYRVGDTAALATLIHRYQKELFGFLARFLHDKAAAEDIFQETFLQIHQSADQFDTDRRFKPWLFTIAANKARDLLRANSRRPVVPLHAMVSPDSADSGDFLSLLASNQETPDKPMEQAELKAKVHSIIDHMPANLREILVLAYFNEFPYKEISDVLEIPLGTVKSRLHSAVAHFAAKWKSTNLPPSAS